MALPLATLVFAGVPMRASRRAFGRGAFWGGHLATALVLAAFGAGPAAIGLTLLTALVGVYAEVDEHGSSVFASSFFAVAGTLGAALIAAGALMAKTKGAIVGNVKSEVAEIARQMTEYNPKIDVNVDAVVYQMPSILAIVLILALAASLIWENRTLRWLKRPLDGGMRERLTGFRVPDACVWIAMLAILGSFASWGKYPTIENSALNVLNVLVAIYFFQGLAVTARAFDAFQVATFWRGFWYVMIALQLHVFVSVLGFADYWADFRTRLPKARGRLESNKQF